MSLLNVTGVLASAAQAAAGSARIAKALMLLSRIAPSLHDYLHSTLVQQQWYPKLPASSPEPSSTTACKIYSPGALKFTVVLEGAGARPRRRKPALLKKKGKIA